MKILLGVGGRLFIRNRRREGRATVAQEHRSQFYKILSSVPTLIQQHACFPNTKWHWSVQHKPNFELVNYYKSSEPIYSAEEFQCND